MLYVYKFTNLINGKIYVGSTLYIARRLIEHTRDSKITGVKTNYLFYRAVNKYGWESFMFDVIEECCPLLRNDRENHWIKYYHTLDKRLGYNMKSADNKIITDTIRQNMSIAGKAKVLTEEHRRKLNTRKKGKDNPLYGKQMSEESRKKMSEAKKGKPRVKGIKPSDETREKMRNAKLGKPRACGSRAGSEHPMYGKKHTEETKKKMLMSAKRGENHPMYGKVGELSPTYGSKRTDEQRKNISEGKKRANALKNK